MADETVLDAAAETEAPVPVETSTPAESTLEAYVPTNEVVDIRSIDGSGDMPARGAPPEETAPEAEAEEPAEGATQSLRDAAQELGYDVSGFSDDATALTHMITEARRSKEQERQLAQYQQMLAAQQRAAPAAPAPEKSDPLWNPPEFNPAWLSQIEKDENGNLVPTGAGTPDTVRKFQEYAQHRQNEQEKFWSNPYEYMRPFVEQVAKDQTMTGLQANQETMTAQQLVEQNKDWLFDDPATRSLSADGQLFSGAIAQIVESSPNSSPQVQYDFAMAKVEAARAQRELETLKAKDTAEQTHEKKKREALGTKPNSSGTLQSAVEQNPDLSLKERMRAELAKHGITDRDFEGSI